MLPDAHEVVRSAVMHGGNVAHRSVIRAGAPDPLAQQLDRIEALVRRLRREAHEPERPHLQLLRGGQ